MQGNRILIHGFQDHLRNGQLTNSGLPMQLQRSHRLYISLQIRYIHEISQEPKLIKKKMI